jgi:hypothetical protein
MVEELKYTKWDADFPQKGQRGKFAPKLQFADRMAWYALYHGSTKVSVAQIAEAAGISPPVAHALLSPHHLKYKNVKKEFQKLGGVVGTTQKYVEDHHIRRLQEVVHGPKPIPRPGQLSLGGREFDIKQEENKWVAYDLEMNLVMGMFETHEQAVDECIAFAKTFHAP